MKKVLYAMLAFCVSAGLFATEITIKVTPTVMFPFLSGEAKKYDIAGGGAFLDPGINLFGFLNVGPEFGVIVLPKNNSKQLAEGIDKQVTFIPVGLQVGAFYDIFSRVEAGGGIAFGAYGATTDKKWHYAPWYRAYADVAFKINTKVSLGLDVSWFNCQNTTWVGNPGAAGITAGIVLKFKIDTEKSSGNVNASIENGENVFPLLYTLYKSEPFGAITINNDETGDIRNVIVKFRAEGYTASEMECGRINMIRKHRSEQLSLCADFNDKILRFSESGKISGEIVIEYSLLGDKRVSVVPVTISVYGRNTLRWFDSAMVASFVYPKSEEVLEISKYSVGIARSHARSGLNNNLQFSMYLFEAMRLAGITCEENSDTPYNSFHINPEVLDYLQYPYQTLSYRSGDKDDIGILFSSMLESVDIPAAFIPLENDFIVAACLGDDSNSLRNMFNGDERILSVDNKIWLPLSMSEIEKGYMSSWAKAVSEINYLLENDEDVDFIILSDAWMSYPTAGFSSNETNVKLPAEKNLYAAGENVLNQYINQEYGPQIASLQARIKSEGASVTLYNQLGMLYVRAGMYDNAVSVYEISAKLGSIPAMNNLGNICTLQKKYKTAKSWYEKVLAIDPTNETALRNLERIATELDY